jgi:hypothetical protein
MSFWERGYLATAGAIALAAGVYAYVIWQRSIEAGALVAPDAASFLTYVIVVVILSALAFILIASRQAIAEEESADNIDVYDERDKQVGNIATAQASHVASFGLYLALVAFIVHGSGNILFYTALGALAIGEISMCLLRVYHYNRGV